MAYGNDYILSPGKASTCLMVSSILEADVQKRVWRELSYSEPDSNILHIKAAEYEL